MKCRDSCRGVFRRHEILTVYGAFVFECLVFLFKKCSFQTESTHSYDTRTLDMLYPKHRLTKTERNVHYKCIKLFNSLPSRFKKEDNFALLKGELKSALISIEPYCVEYFYEGIENYT